MSGKPLFKAGMYLLETLTSGMYNDPLAIYREYIQNSADSIDIALQTNPWNSKRIYIDLDPVEKSITIYDKGAGIPANSADKILSSVGISSKTNENLRGFRGIGRLGGLAFCDHAIFKTKAKNEKIESVQEWDCTKLRNLMSGTSKTTYSLKQLFNKSTNFYQRNSQKKDGSYFEVKLLGVQSFRNHVMDIKKLSDYLSMTAPVPFHPDEMRFGKQISDFLDSRLSNFCSYEIFLNGEPIYKPYRNLVKLTSKGYDEIKGIEFFEICINDINVAYGWYGQRKDFLGAITKSDLSSGIRVRAGNIQIGDKHLLDNCYRENRFNSYMIGEIHVDFDFLIPNSRRDDFIDNTAKGLFYNEVERQLGLPISKLIRLNSRLKSKKENASHLINNASSTKTSLSKNKSNHLNKLIKIQKSDLSLKGKDLLSVLPDECKSCTIMKKFSKAS